MMAAAGSDSAPSFSEAVVAVATGGAYGAGAAAWPRAISEDLGTIPDYLVKPIRYVEPLTLDLDGNELQITRLSQQVLFDATGDGIKTAMARASANDGLVVWDCDGNGSIDSGADFLRDQPLLADGRRAADGFAALSDLDSRPRLQIRRRGRLHCRPSGLVRSQSRWDRPPAELSCWLATSQEKNQKVCARAG